MRFFYDTRRDSYTFSEGQLGFFVVVNLEVTRRCNMLCRYCSEAGAMLDLGLSEIKKIIDRLVASGLKRINITGGEPMLRGDVADILKYAKSKNISVTLSTNGYLLNKQTLQKLMPYIDNIRFSLRGSEEIHDELTGVKGSYYRVIESIKLAKKIGIPISVITTVLVSNVNYMEKVARACNLIGVGKLYYFSLVPRGRAIPLYDRENVTIDKLTREYNRIMELARTEKWPMDIKVGNYTLEGICALVFPNGDLVGVPSFTDKLNQKVIGNILKEDPRDLWEKYPFKENYLDYYRNH